MKWWMAVLTASLLIFRCGFPVYADGSVYTEGALEYRIEDGGIVITGYFGADSVVVIPQEIAGLPVSEVAEGAFTGSSVSEVTFPETIMKISENAVPASCRITFAGEEAGSESPEREANEASAHNEEAIENKADFSSSDAVITESEIILEVPEEENGGQIANSEEAKAKNSNPQLGESKENNTMKEKSREDAAEGFSIPQPSSEDEESAISNGEQILRESVFTDSGESTEMLQGSTQQKARKGISTVITCLLSVLAVLVSVFIVIIFKNKKRRN